MEVKPKLRAVTRSGKEADELPREADTRTKLFRKRQIPMYDGLLHLMIAPDICTLIKRHAHKFPSTDFSDLLHDDPPPAGTVGWDGAKTVGIFLNWHLMTHNAIAHEIEHAANMLLTAIGHRSSRHRDEPQAYLVGKLHEIVYREIKQAGMRVMDSAPTWAEVLSARLKPTI